MFKRILVPVDFSDDNLVSIDYAAKVAGPQTSVTLYHVIEEIEYLDERQDQAFYEKLMHLAKEKMARLLQKAAVRGPRPRTKIEIGRRVVRIVTYATKHEIDLVVMSSHKLDWSRPLEGFSTISHQVAVTAQCPVLLVK